MRRSKAKEQILEVAEKMLEEIGYSRLNVNHVAEKAGVSIGTLYYHFPEGKISILLDVRKRISALYDAAFRERFGEDFFNDVTSFDEGLDRLLDALIDMHYEQRFVLAAMESEVLANLVIYDELARHVDVDSLMMEDSKPVLDLLKTLLDRFPVDEIKIHEGVLLCKTVDVLIHRYVYMESIFGSKIRFKQILTTLIKGILMNNPINC